jgi:prephenate dehydrogenase
MTHPTETTGATARNETAGTRSPIAGVAIASVAIIGARGQMGSLFAARCEAASVRVHRLDRPMADADVRAALADADLCFVSVPAAAVDEVLGRIAPHLAARTILADNVSVKVQPMAAMLAAHAGPVIGTHPLFGPVPDETPTVAVAPGPRPADLAAAPLVEAWIEALGFAHFRTTPEEHDRAMALIQGLNFVTSVAYLAALADDPALERFLTPSFRRRLDAAQKMLTEDAQLFTGLFEANPFGQDAVRRYRNFLHVAAGGDLDILIDRANWWWRRKD